MSPPVALFLGAPHAIELPAIAHRAGFVSILAHWQNCRPQGDTVDVCSGSLVDGTERRSKVTGRIIVKPAMVAVLARNVDALARGRQIALGTGAVWSHALDPPWLPPSSRMDGHGHTSYCLVRFDPVLECRCEGPAFTDRTETNATTGASGDGDGRPSHTDEVRRVPCVATQITASRRAAGLTEPLASQYRGVVALQRLRDGSFKLFDPIVDPNPADDAWRRAVARWLELVREEALPPSAMTLPSEGEAGGEPVRFPLLFETAHRVPTEWLREASFEFLDDRLMPASSNEDRRNTLHRMLCRRIVPSDPVDTETRFVELGVGRTCLVDRLTFDVGGERFRDFSVLGVGLTPYSEGGFLDMGRAIDGKASLVRGWHRKRNAERLEESGCRTGRVVAIVALPGETMVMNDGSRVAAGLVVRAFRCVYRVKQLDPVSCGLHSVQHAPLVVAYVAEKARELRIELGHSGVTLEDDDALAHALERLSPTQESLRAVVADPAPVTPDWSSIVRRARRDIIEEYAPALLRPAVQRLSLELGQDVSSEDYIYWFAKNVAEQVCTWRRLRFLHDYHHPGVADWTPATLFAVGENNVSLLAEFPDLDTALFVDDDVGELMEVLQLSQRDVETLRAQYPVFHAREVVAVEHVVATLAQIAGGGTHGVTAGARALFRDVVREYARD